MLETPNRYKAIPATIAEAASVTGEIDLAWAEAVAIAMPAAWTTAAITVLASPTSGGTFLPVHDDGGTELSITAAASQVIALSAAAAKIAPLRYIKLRSGTTATPVAQAAARELTIICKA